MAYTNDGYDYYADDEDVKNPNLEMLLLSPNASTDTDRVHLRFILSKIFRRHRPGHIDNDMIVNTIVNMARPRIAPDAEKLYRQRVHQLWQSILPHTTSPHYSAYLKRVLDMDELILTEVKDQIQRVDYQLQADPVAFQIEYQSIKDFKNFITYIIDHENIVSSGAKDSPEMRRTIGGVATAMRNAQLSGQVASQERSQWWQEKVERYLSYLSSLKDANQQRSTLLARLRNLPYELRAEVLGHTASIFLPRRKQYDTNTLDESMHALVERLADTKMEGPPPKTEVRKVYPFTALPALEESPRHLLAVLEKAAGGSDARSFSFEGVDPLVDEFKKVAKEAIINRTIVYSRCQFPSSAYPSQVPYPPALQTNLHLIRHLDLFITLQDYVHHGSLSELFQAQDNIPNIKNWIPNLATLKLEIVNFADPDKINSPYKARRGEPDPTTLQEEVSKTIAAMRKVDIKERAVIYYHGRDARRWLHQNEELAANEPTARDGETADANVIARKMVDEYYQTPFLV